MYLYVLDECAVPKAVEIRKLDAQRARIYAVPLYNCVEEVAGTGGVVGNADSWCRCQLHKDHGLAVL